jgi:hypothetical protein
MIDKQQYEMLRRERDSLSSLIEGTTGEASIRQQAIKRLVEVRKLIADAHRDKHKQKRFSVIS